MGLSYLELAKLVIPSLTAFIVAMLAVLLSLKRYKLEKIWERQLAAYTDVCVALGEMKTVVGMLADNIDEGDKKDKEWHKFHNERYRDARRNLSTTVAISDLILPASTRSLLAKLENDISSLGYLKDRYDAYNNEYGIIDDALGELVELGRDALGLSIVERGKAYKQRNLRLIAKSRISH
jgi:hypothetical protein